MNTIGELVKESIDYGSRNLPERAFTTSCLAYTETAKKVYKTGEVSDLDRKKFIKTVWWIISFMGLKQALPLTEDLMRELPKFIPGFNNTQTIEDILLFLIRQNAVTNAMPVGFVINDFNKFENKNGKISLPISMSQSLLGVAIFHPVNKDELIPDNYWINFGNFRTFISELWGREDLAERAMRLS